MIADHDFGRKVNDVKKYLERGDVVKVKTQTLRLVQAAEKVQAI